MARPLLLWFDCTSSAQASDLREQCSKFFEVSCSRTEIATQDILRLRPRALCFDFDYPDQLRLRMMQAIKREHMSLPILMLTLAHSEALAVWAFRAQVWNYLVKPIPVRELGENLRSLAQIASWERRVTRSVARPDPELPHEVSSHPTELAKTALLPALNYIEQHFHEHVSASEVARLCGMSRFRFSRLFHAAFGVTYQDHVLRCRITEACRLLQQRNLSVTEVGFAVGFNDASYFARIFKRYVSLLPSEYALCDHEPRPAIGGADNTRNGSFAPTTPDALAADMARRRRSDLPQAAL
jgi:AraC-like DNA-binding protein